MFAIVGREPHCSAGECQSLGTDKQNTPNWAQVLRDMFECVWETWAESALASEGVARLKGETKADMLLEEMNALELWFIARLVCPFSAAVPLCLEPLAQCSLTAPTPTFVFGKQRIAQNIVRRNVG